MNDDAIYNGRDGTAGGATFGAALRELARERSVDETVVAAAAGFDSGAFGDVVAGKRRVGVGGLAAFAHALRLKPIEFLQKTGILGLSAYAGGLDPLFFLPEGQLRYDARIYMREINPRHRVPEGDMTKRNPALEALTHDEILDQLGRLELEMAYLLRAAVQQTGGSL